MHDELELTDEQLRQATSRALAAGEELDSQMSVVRDCFLSLGHALEAAAAEGIDEESLIAKLRGSHASPLPRRPPVVADQRRQRRWLVWVAGALAASALIAMGRIDMQQRHPGANDRSAAIGQAAQGSNVSAWHDALDDQIASAEVQVQQLAADARGLEGSLSEMNSRLRAMSQELLSESL